MLLLRLLNPHISLLFSNLSTGLRSTKFERIEYKLLSLTYKVLTTSQPSYLNNLISVQHPRSNRSSSVVTLSRPPTISSLKITDRSFRYASLRLWNQLSDSFRQPRHSCLDSPPHSLVSSSLSSPPLSSSITPLLQAQNLPFQQILPTLDFFYLLDCFHDKGLDRTYHAHRFIFSFTFYFFVCSVWWTKLITRQIFTAR